MNPLVTFPGRAGDILWMLPTARALAQGLGHPVDLVISDEFAGLTDLLRSCPYLGSVEAISWSLTPPNEWKAPIETDRPLVHLGYRGWPTTTLPYEIYLSARANYPDLPWGGLDLSPWITVDGPGIPLDIAAGFTETYFELKVGLLVLLERLMPDRIIQLCPVGSRWDHAVPGYIAVQACSWLDAARAIRNADLFFGDCSALHVLAVALGKPAILMEPMQARLNEVFWPLGKDGPRVTLVRGGDGLATFDVNHCREYLQRALQGATA